jgi:hypothetical protein
LAYALLALTVAAQAAPHGQEGQGDPAQGETQPAPPQACGECHLSITERWSHSPHAHAYDDPFFQQSWQGLGQPGECLLCHTTDYQESTGQFMAPGVVCEACHGATPPEHPPAPVPILADTEYCGECHTTTLAEWRLTAHSLEDIGCMDCHDPHSQDPLFEVKDDLCINCHRADMGDYLEDLHIKKGIGCVDCHALVIPPEVPPEDGIVPTGHSFTITPATCVACHTDALHSGFSLPGYENGAREALAASDSPPEEEQASGPETYSIARTSQTRLQELQQQVEILSAALASQRMTTLFQGAVVGLALGASTAWIVAHNVRKGRKEEDDGAE